MVLYQKILIAYYNIIHLLQIFCFPQEISFKVSSIYKVWINYILSEMGFGCLSYRKLLQNIFLSFSIAGDAPPASCVFSQVMNLAAFVGMKNVHPVICVKRIYCVFCNLSWRNVCILCRKMETGIIMNIE